MDASMPLAGCNGDTLTRPDTTESSFCGDRNARDARIRRIEYPVGRVEQSLAGQVWVHWFEERAEHDVRVREDKVGEEANRLKSSHI